MTVRELIEALQKMPPEHAVEVCVEIDNQVIPDLSRSVWDRNIYADAFRVTLDQRGVVIEGVNSR